MLIVPLAIAVLISPGPTADALSVKAVVKHLDIGLMGGPDHTGDVPGDGPYYLARCEERCHDALLTLLAGIESGRYKVSRDVNMLSVFTSLTNQTCDRSRFLPYAEKYALGDLKGTKLDRSARLGAIELLGQIGSDKHVVKLLELMTDDDHAIRIYVLEAVGKLGDERHTADVLATLNYDRPKDDFRYVEAEQRRINDLAKALEKKPTPKSALKPSRPPLPK